MMILMTCLLLGMSLSIMGDEPIHDLFKFDNLYSFTDCLLANASESAFESVSTSTILN